MLDLKKQAKICSTYKECLCIHFGDFGLSNKVFLADLDHILLSFHWTATWLAFATWLALVTWLTECIYFYPLEFSLQTVFSLEYHLSCGNIFKDYQRQK